MGRPLPAGQPGALAIRRDDPGLFLGYLDQPRDNGDWYATGDQARIDDQGAITLLGRNDDVMNAGGFRVSPAEVEDVLAAHPCAGDVAVTELPVAGGASVIAAFWTGTATADELQALAAEGLARYKQPRNFIALPDLPRTPTGKINRRALREAYRKDRS